MFSPTWEQLDYFYNNIIKKEYGKSNYIYSDYTEYILDKHKLNVRGCGTEFERDIGDAKFLSKKRNREPVSLWLNLRAAITLKLTRDEIIAFMYDDGVVLCCSNWKLYSIYNTIFEAFECKEFIRERDGVCRTLIFQELLEKNKVNMNIVRKEFRI